MNDDLTTDEQLEREAMRPAYKFKGKELWPWSRAARLYWRMICDDEKDVSVFQWLAFIFVLQKRTERTAAEDFRKHIIPAVYGDPLDLKAKIIEWRNELTDDDELEAKRIHDRILKAEMDSRIHISPEPGQKKTTPKSRRKSAIS